MVIFMTVFGLGVVGVRGSFALPFQVNQLYGVDLHLGLLVFAFAPDHLYLKC